MMVARRLAVLGDVNAGKASTLAMMGAELDRVRAAVWARFSGTKTAQLSKRQVRDQLMGENAPKEFGVPQRLWRATVEDTVDRIRTWHLGRKKLSARRAPGRWRTAPHDTSHHAPVVGCERNNLPPKRTTTVRGR